MTSFYQVNIWHGRQLPIHYVIIQHNISSNLKLSLQFHGVHQPAVIYEQMMKKTMPMVLQEQLSKNILDFFVNCYTPVTRTDFSDGMLTLQLVCKIHHQQNLPRTFHPLHLSTSTKIHYSHTNFQATKY